MSTTANPYLLPETPHVPDVIARDIAADYERFARDGLPARLEDYLLDRYRLDVATTYAGLPIPNPWGKASGQLSMTARQVAEDVEAGLGFIVLKTVIAQDEAGAQSMQAWAIREARMVAERIVGHSGEEGWTISWKGRGWWQSFDEYLALVRDARQIVRDARQIARGSGTLIVPSCKYHLPGADEHDWKIAEYEHTTRRLLEAWHGAVGWLGQSAAVPQQSAIHETGASQSLSPSHPGPSQSLSPTHPGSSHPGPTHQEIMPLEKDFSPTLAGSDRAAQQAKILEWLRTVPRLIRSAAAPVPIRVGLKIFNALFDDDFQLEMLRAIHQPGPDRPDFYVYANRLFDPDREFDGHRGIAYGGPDLSDRNLRVMTRFVAQSDAGRVSRPVRTGQETPATEAVSSAHKGAALECSATGNITTGRMALEYALRGATSFQLHTFFQLPAEQYAMKAGGKTHKALLELYFHPQTGLVVWMHHLARALGLAADPVRFADVIGRM